MGNANRRQSPTDANATSSRSHAVLQITVRQQERTRDVSESVKVAKLSLIDLAGSERAAVSQVCIYIRYSLMGSHRWIYIEMICC